MNKTKKKIIIIACVLVVVLLFMAIAPFLFRWPYKNFDPPVADMKPDFDLSSMLLQYKIEGEDFTVTGAGKINLKSIKVANMYFGMPITNVGAGAFAGNSTVQKVVLPETVKRISHNAFANCAALETISVPNSVTNISATAFAGCTSLKYNEYENALYLGNDANPYHALIKVVDTSVSEFVVHSGATVFADSAFAGCDDIETITFKGSVIPRYKFSELASLTTILTEAPVVYLPEESFRDCEHLETVDLGDSLVTIGSYAFAGCKSLKEFNIPSTVTTIGKGVFTNCASIVDITIPESATSIGAALFSGCSSLESVTLPSNMTVIGESFFSGCSSLNGVTIPESVTTIGKSAFTGCASLTGITIPAAVTSIGDSAFSNCSGLVSITIPESVTAIANSTFSGCASLESVVLPATLKTIGNRVFYGCESLVEISLPDSITAVGNTAFDKCNSLVFSEYDNAYYLGNESNPYLVLIKAKSDSDDVKVESCVVHENTKVIAANAFASCKNLTSITISASVKNMGEKIFDGCTKFTTINYDGTMEDWKSVSKHGKWDDKLKTYTIHCTDGDIVKEEKK